MTVEFRDEEGQPCVLVRKAEYDSLQHKARCYENIRKPGGVFPLYVPYFTNVQIPGLEVSNTTQELIDLLVERDQAGRAKYGTTLDRTDLAFNDWLQHMAEELLDGAGYALAAKRTNTPAVAAAPVVDARLANWIIAAVGDIPYSTMTSEQVIAALEANRRVYEGSEGCGTHYRASTPAAPGIDLTPFRASLVAAVRLLARHGSEADMNNVADLIVLIDASPKGGSTDAEPKIWGTQKPGSMPKLFGARHIAELNWYPDEGCDLICMQVIERVQPTSHGAGVSDG